VLRILALGDSYTIGEGVSAEQRWPVQLVKRLREQGVSASQPLILAETGWTTDDLSAAIRVADFSGPFDLVTLLIGANNQYQDRDLNEYRSQFRNLLRQAIAFTGGKPGRVLVLSIPDWSVTPFAEEDERWQPVRGQIAAQIDAFNQVNRAESENAGVLYLDITSLTRQKGCAPGWFAADGLHPSARIYGAWADLALPLVLRSTGSPAAHSA
jgi:lysophospholipase L1-like esterase